MGTSQEENWLDSNASMQMAWHSENGINADEKAHMYNILCLEWL